MTRMKGINFENFLQEVKRGRRDFLVLLDKKESDFHTATFEQLMSNEDDVLVGVNKVLYSSYDNYFDLFNYALIKEHDNGDLKHIFHSIIQNDEKIMKAFTSLIKILGKGFVDTDRFLPFTYQNTHDLASKKIEEGKDILHLWNIDDLSILLQYRSNPLHQFSIMLTTKAPVIIDRSIRRKGTILDILKFELSSLFLDEEIAKNESFQNGELRFIDYVFNPHQKVLGAFDRIHVRIFSSKRMFDKNIHTNVTCYSSTQISATLKTQVVEAIIRIYGQDIYGQEELLVHEMDIIDEGRYWIGRSYRMNEIHGLQTNSEKMSYEIQIDDTLDENGFKLHILGFNQLFALFGVE